MKPDVPAWVAALFPRRKDDELAKRREAARPPRRVRQPANRRKISR